MEYTPEPWEIHIIEDVGYTIRNPTINQDDGSLMYDPIVSEDGGIDSYGNAQLISLAPGMYRVLRSIEMAWEDGLEFDHTTLRKFIRMIRDVVHRYDE